MNVLDLFSGIGGFSLGLERAGMRTVAFCEIEPYARAVLRKHWPHVPCYDDVRSLTADRLTADGIRPDVICGGFPCQDISAAGKRTGIEGERSGLWKEYARLIGEIGPRYVIVENVSALLNRGLDVVLGDLASLGFDAEWHCIPASAVGAPHRRDRLWLVAYPNGQGVRKQPICELWGSLAALSIANGSSESLADADSRRRQPRGERQEERRLSVPIAGSEIRIETASADANGQSTIGPSIAWRERGHWLIEPDVGRVADGIPSRVDRLKGLGNAVVPQIPDLRIYAVEPIAPH